MHFAAPLLAALPTFALVVSLAFQSPDILQVPDDDDGDSGAARVMPVVTIFDNAASGMGFNRDQAFWGFGPYHVEARQGATVAFYNPDTNAHPHTVTSLVREGSPFANRVAVGSLFDSSPNQADLIAPGGAFRLDTSRLAPGQYPYFCKLHPWMTGFVTVLPGSRER
jgi:plastocyanin